jgi:hypothetical protein
MAQQMQPLLVDNTVKATTVVGSRDVRNRQMSWGGHESGEMFVASR